VRRSSERIVLICEECGERLVLVGAEEVWRSDRTAFVCECEVSTTLAERLDREVLRAEELLRGLGLSGA
jgi:hypothetical protein